MRGDSAAIEFGGLAFEIDIYFRCAHRDQVPNEDRAVAQDYRIESQGGEFHLKVASRCIGSDVYRSAGDDVSLFAELQFDACPVPWEASGASCPAERCWRTSPSCVRSLRSWRVARPQVS